MCPTPLGRIHTRVATIALPALAGGVLWLITGREDWLVLVGVWLLLGVALDSALYSWLITYQPPWMTGVLAAGELALLLVIAEVIDLDLTVGETIGLYLVAWVLASITRIAVLPIVALTYLESSGEFRRVEWSIPPEQASLPVLASAEEAVAGPGALIQAASGAHAKPPDLVPSPSGVHGGSRSGPGAGAGTGADRRSSRQPERRDG